MAATTKPYSPRNYALLLASLIAGLTGLFGYIAAIAARRVNRGEFSDFRVFYFAAEEMLRHGDPYAVQHRSYIYPPLIAFCYMPLAMLGNQKTAAAILLPLDLFWLLLALFFGAREILRRFNYPVSSLAICAISLLAALPLMDKVKGEIQMFQTNGLILLMFCLALAWLDDHPLLAGAALGLAMNIKYLPLGCLPYLLIRRRWTAAGAMVVWTVAFALLPAVHSGWNTNLQHLSIAAGGLGRMVGLEPTGQAAEVGDIAAGFSLSFTSAISRLAKEHHVNHLALPVTALALLAVVGGAAIWYRINRIPLLCWPAASGQKESTYRQMMALEWAGLIAMTLAFSPQTNSRHLVLLLMTSGLLALLALAPRPGAKRWPAVAGIVVLAAGTAFPFGGNGSYLAKHCRAWYTFAGYSWSILLAYGLLLWAGLPYVRSIASGSGEHLGQRLPVPPDCGIIGQ